jgi:hypothetical protein
MASDGFIKRAERLSAVLTGVLAGVLTGVLAGVLAPTRERVAEGARREDLEVVLASARRLDPAYVDGWIGIDRLTDR